MKPTDERFREVFHVLERHIEDRYGIPVLIKDVPDPFTGDLDGSEIHVDFDEHPESALFILVHLFGHTVQWARSERDRKLAVFAAENPTPQLLDELERYEREACQLSLTLLHDAGVRDMDQWLADFAGCDFRYLRHFYVHKEKAPFLSFWQDGEPLLEPVPIPDFHPTRWISRAEGIVI